MTLKKKCRNKSIRYITLNCENRKKRESWEETKKTHFIHVDIRWKAKRRWPAESKLMSVKKPQGLRKRLMEENSGPRESSAWKCLQSSHGIKERKL